MAARTLITVTLCAALAAVTGCVTEAGRSGPALWKSVSDGADASAKLRHPKKTNLRFAELAERRGRHSVARQHYQSVLKQDPKSADAIVGLARLDQYAGQTRAAEAGFEKAYRLAPRNPRVLHSVGLFRAAQERWTESKGLLHAAVAAAPRSREFRKSLGLVLAKAGDYKGAWPHLVASMGEGEAHYYIGSYLLESGDRERAAYQFQMAVTKSPGLDEARERLAQLGVRQQERQIAERPVNRNQQIRSVGHVGGPRDAGTRTAWGNDLDRRQPHRERTQSPRHSVPELKITPRKSSPSIDDGPIIQPGPSRRRLQPRPDPISQQPATPKNLSPQQLQQWSNQQQVP